MKSNLFFILFILSASAVATTTETRKVETKSDKIDYRLNQIESRLKEISQKISLSAQAPKRQAAPQDNRQVKLDSFKQSLVSFTEGLDQRQLFIRHEMKRTFQKFLSSSNPWTEIEGLSRNISFYAKAIPSLNVSAESKKYAIAQINQINNDAQELKSLSVNNPVETNEVSTKPNTVLVEAGNDLLYLQNDIHGVREDVAQLAISKIQASNSVKSDPKADALVERSKYIGLAVFFVCSVILGFVMRGRTNPRKKLAPNTKRKAPVANVAVTTPVEKAQPEAANFKLPPLPVDMGLSSSEMEEYLNYLEIPIIVIDENKSALWSNAGAYKASLSSEKFSALNAEGLIDSMGYPVVIHNGVLYRVNTTHIAHSCWSGKNVNLIQLVPHEYSQVEFSSIKNKGKFITDIKSQTKEKNNINTVLLETVDRFKYLFAQSNISFDYLPLDEDAFINMKREELDKHCRDIIYMLNRLVLDSNQKHELLVEAKLNDDRVHFKFYLMNYSYQLQPDQQERLNNEFMKLHGLENSLSAYQGRVTLRSLKGEISSLEIDLSFNLYPTGSTYANVISGDATA